MDRCEVLSAVAGRFKSRALGRRSREDGEEPATGEEATTREEDSGGV